MYGIMTKALSKVSTLQIAGHADDLEDAYAKMGKLAYTSWGVYLINENGDCVAGLDKERGFREYEVQDD